MGEWEGRAGHRTRAWVLVLAVLASACGGTDSPKAAGSPLQLRPVRDILPRTSPRWNATEVTCSAEDAARCLANRGDESVIVLGADETEKYLLGPVVVEAGDVEEATARQEKAHGMGWSVDVRLSPEGSDALASATRAAVGQIFPKDRIAIVVDGLVVSSPTVAEPITAGSVVVAGGLSESEAKRLAARLNARE